jgi:thioredoxin-related protein
MRISNFRTAIAVLVLLASLALAKADGGWSDDYKVSLERAKAGNKLALLDFTASDWCPPCLRLHKEVFSKPRFQEYARKNLVLVEVDFPLVKEQPSRVKQQNESLAFKYDVHAYPTLIVVNAAGKKVGEVSYHGGGPDAFISQIERLSKS